MLINNELTKEFYNLHINYKGIKMEPTLNQIEDYDGKESPQKRKIIYMVIAGLLALGLGYTLVKNSVDSNMPNSFIPYDK